MVICRDWRMSSAVALSPLVTSMTGQPQVGRDFGVELELEHRVLAQKVRAHAEHEVVLHENFFELLDDVF